MIAHLVLVDAHTGLLGSHFGERHPGSVGGECSSLEDFVDLGLIELAVDLLGSDGLVESCLEEEKILAFTSLLIKR